MGKNKNKKQTEDQTIKTEKSSIGSGNTDTTINGNKSDIDKILDDWLNGCDDDEIPDKSDEQTAKAKQKEKNERVSLPEPVKNDVETGKTLTPKEPSSGYKALPMEDANDAWMDDDVCFTMEDEEDEDLVLVTKKETKSETTKEYKPKIPEALKKETHKTDMPEESKSKSSEVSKVGLKVEKKLQKKLEVAEMHRNDKASSKKSDDIDSVLDDWLNDADDEVPDELPDINDIKKETKKNVKAAKTQKKNALLNDMSKLSNIMDDKTDKNVQSSVENFFGGFNKKPEPKPEPISESRHSPVKKKPEPKTDDIDSILDDWMNGGEEEIKPKKELNVEKNNQVKEEPKKEETKIAVAQTETKKVPEGDCILCGKLAR